MHQSLCQYVCEAVSQFVGQSINKLLMNSLNFSAKAKVCEPLALVYMICANNTTQKKNLNSSLHFKILFLYVVDGSNMYPF